MKKCCEANRGTPFCPICGMELNPPPSVMLLFHIEKCLSESRENLRRMMERKQTAASDSEARDYRNQKICSMKRLVEKWASWREDLKRLIALDSERKAVNSERRAAAETGE